MKSKIAAILVGLFLVFVLFAVAYPVVYSKFPHHIDRHSSTIGPPISKMARMTVTQDATDSRVISIKFTNITAQPVILVNDLGRTVQNFAFAVTDGQGHHAPLTAHGKRIDADFHLWHTSHEWQTHHIAPGRSLEYQFDLTDTIDLSKLQSAPYTLAVTYTPQNIYSGTVTATTQIIAPQPTSKPLPFDVIHCHV